METPGLMPLPDTIPVHWGWFEGLLLLTFVVHLLFMNAMLGTSIIAFVNHFKKGSEDRLETNRDLAAKLPFIIAFTINFGVPPFLFFQVLYGNVGYVSTVLMATLWMSVVVLLIIAYYSAYAYRLKFDALGSKRPIFIGLTAVILLIIGFFFSNNFTLMLHPERWSVYFSNPSGTVMNLDDPTLYPRYLHFAVSSVAVGGLFIAVVSHLRLGRGQPGMVGRIQTGMGWFFYATLAQIPIGLWFLHALPLPVRDAFLGGSAMHTHTLLLGVLASFVILVLARKKKVVATTVGLVFTVAIMAVSRELMRQASLKDHFSPSSLIVVPEYSPMVVFFVCLAVGLAFVVYMLKTAWTATVEGGRK